MSSNADYRAPLDDIFFAIEQVSGVQRLNRFDPSLAREILGHGARFVEGVIAPAEPGLDQDLPRLEGGRVKVSPALIEIVQKYSADGWFGLSVPEEHGGQGQPLLLSNVLMEMLSSASLNASMALIPPSAALKLVLAEATDAQKSSYVSGLISGEYNATIVLSEPQAGSDLRLVRTIAKPDNDGWRLSGAKIFCSNADHDMAPNILHCIVARTDGAPEGTKGLGLFLCPAVLPDGSRNNISVVRVEKKMGLHASPTCQVNFDGAWAERVGDAGEGLKRMFTMMNAMRMDTALQGLGMCQIALQRSLDYAAERVQGRSIASEAASSEPIPIAQHGDIKRQLQIMEALSLGCRAMLYRVSVALDLDPHSEWVQFMLPVCKVFVSDAGNLAADMAIQIHGGYGFVSDHQIEQIARDGRVARIYEGANGLHATNLATGLRRPMGQAGAAAFEAEILETIKEAPELTQMALTSTLELWVRARDHVAGLSDPGMVAYDFMTLTGLVSLASVWSCLERSHTRAPDPERILRVAAFFRDWMLPETDFRAGRILRA